MTRERKKLAKSLKVQIPADAIIARNNHLITTMVDDELVCTDEITGHCCGLNTTGKMIWELLEYPLTLQKIVANVITLFPGNEDSISEDIPAFLTDLAMLNIITISGVNFNYKKSDTFSTTKSP